jgi:hypothetical protein
VLFCSDNYYALGCGIDRVLSGNNNQAVNAIEAKQGFRAKSAAQKGAKIQILFHYLIY